MRRSGKLSLGLAAVVLVVSIALYWLVATTAGARWLLARVDSLLPVQLALVNVDGSLTRGLRFDAVAWTDDGVSVSAADVGVHVELLPVLQRVVRILELEAGSLDVVLRELPADRETAADDGPFELDLPVDILLEQARVERIAIERGDFSRRIDAIDLVADLRGPRLAVSNLQLASDWLNVTAAGESRLSRDFATDATLSWSMPFDGRNFAGRLVIDGDRDGFDTEHALSSPFAFETDGNIAFDEQQLVVDLDNRWTDVSWRVGEREFRSSEGALTLDGPLDALGIGLDLLASIDDIPVTSVTATGVTDLERLDGLDVVLQNELGLLSASGSVAWSPSVRFDANFELSGVDPVLLHETLSGDVGASGQANGNFAGDGYLIAVGLKRLDGTVNDAPLNGSGRFELQTDSISFDALDVGLGSNRITADGRLADRIDLSIDASLANIGEIVPDTSGSMRADIDIGGSRDAPAMTATMNAERIAWTGVAADSANVSVSMTPAGLINGQMTFDQLTSGERSIRTGAINVDGTVTEHRLDVTLDGFDGTLSLAAVGGWSDATWNGELQTLELDNSLTGTWRSESPASVSASRESGELNRLCLARDSNTGRACVDATYGAAGDVAAELLVEALPFSALRLPLPDGVAVEADVFADASARVAAGRISGASTVELRDARVQTSIEDETYETDFSTMTTRATLDDNRLEAVVDIRTTNDTAAVEATLGIADIAEPGSALSGSGSLRVDDATILASLVPDLSEPRGRMAGNIELGGSIDVPEVTGEIRLTDGAFRIRRAGIDISDIELSLSQLSPGSLQLRGSATSGDGELSITGDTYLGTETGLRTELLISGDDFEILRLPDWQTSASPNVSIVVDEQRTLVTGEIVVPTADITVKDVPASATSPSKDAVVHRSDVTRAEEVKRTLDVDLRASLGDDVRLKAFGLNTGLGGSMQLRGGSAQAWRGFGRVELTDGIYKAYGQELTIERGLLIFNGPLDSPQLDVRAIREVDAITAGIHLTGTPTDLRSSVYSDPPLRDAEALSYLLTGRPLSSATASGEGDLLGNAAFALGLSGAGLVASRVRSQLGLDSLSIEGGADDGRIIAGKRLNSRLLVEYGYGLVDRLGSLLLRYQLNERVVIESRTGASSNVDIVYRVRKQ